MTFLYFRQSVANCSTKCYQHSTDCCTNFALELNGNLEDNTFSFDLYVELGLFLSFRVQLNGNIKITVIYVCLNWSWMFNKILLYLHLRMPRASSYEHHVSSVDQLLLIWFALTTILFLNNPLDGNCCQSQHLYHLIESIWKSNTDSGIVHRSEKHVLLKYWIGSFIVS